MFSVLLTVQLILFIPGYIRPISLSAATSVILILMQTLSVFFIYNFKNQKIIRNRYLRTQYTEETQISKGETDDIVDIDNKEGEKVKADRLNFKDFRSKPYNVMGILLFGLAGIFASAEFYEQNISYFTSLTLDFGSAEHILSYSLLILIGILIPLTLTYLDRFFVRMLTPLMRVRTLLLYWLGLSVFIFVVSNLIAIQTGGVQKADSVTPALLFCLSILQYYTMYLITNLIILSSGNEDISKLFSKSIQKFPEKMEKDAENILGYNMDWSNIYPKSKRNQIRRKYLLALISVLNPEKIRKLKIINILIGVFIYFLISFSSTLMIFNLVGSIILSIIVGSAVLYVQSELNYHYLKSFSSKINSNFSAFTWIVFSVCISVLPLFFWNTSFNINLFCISLMLVIFNITFFWAALILKREILKEIDVTLGWFPFLRVTLYCAISFSCFSIILNIPVPGDPVPLAIFIASLVLYFSMVFEKNNQVIMTRTMKIIKIISGLTMAFTSSSWIFDLISWRSIELGLVLAALTFTLLFLLTYNPFKLKRKRWDAPLYWLIISVEIGLLSGILNSGISYAGIVTGSIFMMLYPILFELQKLLEILRNIADYLRYLYEKTVTFLINVIKRIRRFMIAHKNFIIFMGVVLLDVILYYLLIPLFIMPYMTLSISSAIASVFLYPIFYEKDQLKSEQTFSRMVYYSLIVYVFFNNALYSLVFTTPLFFSYISIWLLLSVILFMSILLVVIYRREKIYNLSIKWRFWCLIICILLVVILAVIIGLYTTGTIKVST